MGHEVGVACGLCDAYAPTSARFCARCGGLLAIVDVSASHGGPALASHVRAAPPIDTEGPTPQPFRPVELPAPPEIADSGVLPRKSSGALKPVPPPPEAKPKLWSPKEATPLASSQQASRSQPEAQAVKEDLMEQARHYVCKECSTPVPSGHKFCGRCGAVVPPQILDLRTDFFGAMQAPGKARLILIRGDAGTDGLSYLLQGTEHVAGRRDGQIVFPDDSWLSPRHANFVYRGEKLVVRDEGSLNGVYLRVRGQTPIEPGDLFLAGEQVFRLDRTPADTSGPDPDMTYFYSSPKRPSPFRITQMLRGGGEGMVVCSRENQCGVGREDCDLNFPEDVYMSANHARVVSSPDGSFSLVDNNSKNGTYVRIRGERELAHGDYLFLGRQLLRVEITA